MPREHTPDSKFQLRNAGELMHPGACLSCGSGTREEGYVDLGVYFDYEGQMYLCSLCLEEAAEILGCLSIAESKFLQGQNEQLAQQVQSLKEQLTHANRRLRAYDDIASPLIDAVGSDRMADSASNETEPLFDYSGVRATSGSISGESESSESITSGSGLTGSTLSERGDESERVNRGPAVTL